MSAAPLWPKRRHRRSVSSDGAPSGVPSPPLHRQHREPVADREAVRQAVRLREGRLGTGFRGLVEGDVDVKLCEIFRQFCGPAELCHATICHIHFL